jgi:hypothetical protein
MDGYTERYLIYVIRHIKLLFYLYDLPKDKTIFPQFIIRKMGDCLINVHSVKYVLYRYCPETEECAEFGSGSGWVGGGHMCG